MREQLPNTTDIHVINPNATRATTTQALLENPRAIFETTGNWDHDVLALSERILGEEKSRVLTYAGDGGNSLVLNALVEATRTARRGAFALDTAMTPLEPKGNGNDFFHMLHGSSSGLTMTDLALRATEQTFHPLLIQIDGSNTSTERSGIYTAGVNMSAAVSGRLSEKSHRTRLGYNNATMRTLYEGLIIGGKLLSVQPFKALQMGRHVSYSDISFFNGPRCAKKFRPGVQLSKPEMRVVASPTRYHVAASAGRLALGRPTGEITSDPYRFKALQDVAMHVDAEEIMIPSGSVVTVGISEISVTVLATQTI